MSVVFYFLVFLCFVLGLDVFAITGVAHDMIQSGGMKTAERATSFMVVYIAHILAFIACVWATVRVGHEP